MNFKLSYSLVTFFAALATLAITALTASAAMAQTTGWSIISTAPSPIVPNTPSSITVRLSADSYPTRTVYCPNVFGAPGALSVTILGDVITVEQIEHSFKAPFPGFDLFCDATYNLPPLAAGRYEVRLKFVYDFPFGAAQPEAFSIGTVCVGACVIQQVPLNFAAGSAFWWLAIASLLGMGVFTLRRKWKR
jgi:hypothetical protein